MIFEPAANKREELEGLRRLSAFSPPEGLNIPTQSSIEQSQQDSDCQNITFSN